MHEHQSTKPENPTEAGDGTERERELAPEPRIYVASLADYNNGGLHGVWLNAAREPAEIRADVANMLAASKYPDAEEWAIHDQIDFGNWRVEEYDSFELVSRIARGIKEHGYAFAAWADVHDSDPERFNDFEAAFIGHFESVDTYAYQLADDFGYHAEIEKLPESMRSYVSIDYAAMARDLDAGGELYAYPDPSGGVWLFDGNV
jgi:antirestriction protein